MDAGLFRFEINRVADKRHLAVMLFSVNPIAVQINLKKTNCENTASSLQVLINGIYTVTNDNFYTTYQTSHNRIGSHLSERLYPLGTFSWLTTFAFNY